MRQKGDGGQAATREGGFAVLRLSSLRCDRSRGGFDLMRSAARRGVLYIASAAELELDGSPISLFLILYIGRNV